MAIRVRYFASLRERMGRSEEMLVADGLVTVGGVWRAVDQGRPLPAQVLCAINAAYARPDSPVADGDEVAFFPQVTGG